MSATTLTTPARRPGAAAVVSALRQRTTHLIDAELQRLAARVPYLDAASRGEVATTLDRVVECLLHDAYACTDQALVHALGMLFALPPVTGTPQTGGRNPR
jgi:hypothetical protein